MLNFKDPSAFASPVPPVPDVKSWLYEFRTKHQYSKPKHGQFHHQISSLNSANDTLRMEFETMALSNKDMHSDHSRLQSQYNSLQQSHITLQSCHAALQLKYEAATSEITKLHSQMARLNNTLSSSNTITPLPTIPATPTTSDVHEDEKTQNENSNPNTSIIGWNFSMPSNEPQTNETALPTRKRIRSPEPSDRAADRMLPTIKHAKLSSIQAPKSSLSSSPPARASSIDPNSILERRLPGKLDLIRGDILAEAGCDDQISFCLDTLVTITTEEWETRNFLMDMVVGLGQESRCIDWNAIYEARHCLKKQLMDLRSTVVKATCELLLACSLYCDKSKYGQCLAYFIPVHLQGLYVTIACIREAHQSCLEKSLGNVRSLRCVAPLLKGLKSKHAEVRSSVLVLLAGLVEHMDEGGRMDKYVDRIGGVVAVYVGDANGSVRTSVKRLFETFADKFPGKARMLLSRMDVSKQKTLRKCVSGKQKTKYKNEGGAAARTRKK